MGLDGGNSIYGVAFFCTGDGEAEPARLFPFCAAERRT